MPIKKPMGANIMIVNPTRTGNENPRVELVMYGKIIGMSKSITTRMPRARDAGIRLLIQLPNPENSSRVNKTDVSA